MNNTTYDMNTTNVLKGNTTIKAWAVKKLRHAALVLLLAEAIPVPRQAGGHHRPRMQDHELRGAGHLSHA